MASELKALVAIEHDLWLLWPGLELRQLWPKWANNRPYMEANNGLEWA
jgi:hypothetical protein